MQTDFTLQRTASLLEMKRAAKKVVETMRVYFNEEQNRITRIVSKETGAEIFNVYEMARNIPSMEELFHAVNSCLTVLFATAFIQCSIPSRHFDITKMEELIALESHKRTGEAKNEQW